MNGSLYGGYGGGGGAGTLMRNTHRHENVSINQPPTNGPTALAMPARPAHAPIAATTIDVVEARADDREAPGHEERAGRALQRAGDGQHGGVRGERAHRRSRR